MRDISQLHPKAQLLADALVKNCAAAGITIKITECARTVAEQDALYAKGRTVPGGKVTNARGSSYSSMHQWRVAFDFCLNMDVDKDGKISDDIFNNVTGLFNKVGQIGKALGLEWGGDWKSIKDLPHFQLPDWGSTTAKLKATYGTPEKFAATWAKTPVTVKVPVATPVTVVIPDYKKALAVALGLPETSDAKTILSRTITLRKGCEGKAVAAVQAYWKSLGLYTGNIDGDWGKQSDAACYNFQHNILGFEKPDKEFTAGGKSWKKMLGLI